MKKTSRPGPTLQLHAQTVRVISDREIADVHGGFGTSQPQPPADLDVLLRDIAANYRVGP